MGGGGKVSQWEGGVLIKGVGVLIRGGGGGGPNGDGGEGVTWGGGS